MGPVTGKKVFSIMALCAMVSLLLLPVVMSIPSPAAGEEAAADGAKKDGDKIEKGRDVDFIEVGDLVIDLVKKVKPDLERQLLEKGNAAIVKAAGTKEIKLELDKLPEPVR